MVGATPGGGTGILVPGFTPGGGAMPGPLLPGGGVWPASNGDGVGMGGATLRPAPLGEVLVHPLKASNMQQIMETEHRI